MSDDKVEMLMVSLLQTIDKRLEILCTDNDVLKDRQDQALATMTDLDGRLQQAVAQMEVIARILGSVMGDEVPSTSVPASPVSPFASPPTFEAAAMVVAAPFEAAAMVVAAPFEAAPMVVAAPFEAVVLPVAAEAPASAPVTLPELVAAPLAVPRPESAVASPSRLALEAPPAPTWAQHAPQPQDAPLLAAAPQPAPARDDRSLQQTSPSGIGEMNLSAFADLLNTGLIDLFAEQPA